MGLCCFVRAFSCSGEQGLIFTAVLKFLVAVASLVAEYGLYGAWGSALVAQGLSTCSSGAQHFVVLRLSCTVAWGIFPGQRSNPFPFHRKADS